MLERRADKKEILELYLNEIYLGQAGSFGINGVGEAARMYFHKDVGNLTLPESALLAGMIQSPNPYNPYPPPEARDRAAQPGAARDGRGRLRRRPPPLKAAMAQPLHRGARHASTPPRRRTSSTSCAPQLAERYDAQDLTTQNLSIYTTLDLHLQALAPGGAAARARRASRS